MTFLKQRITYGVATCVTLDRQFLRSVIRRENRGIAAEPLELLEAFFLRFVPIEINVLPGYFAYRGVNLAEVMEELRKVLQKTEKSSNIFLRLRCGHFGYCSRLLCIQLQTVLTDDVSDVFDPALFHLAFVEVQLQIVFCGSPYYFPEDLVMFLGRFRGY